MDTVKTAPVMDEVLDFSQRMFTLWGIIRHQRQIRRNKPPIHPTILLTPFLKCITRFSPWW